MGKEGEYCRILFVLFYPPGPHLGGVYAGGRVGKGAGGGLERGRGEAGDKSNFAPQQMFYHQIEKGMSHW